MSTTLYVALDREVDGIELNNDRVLLAKLVGDAPSMSDLCSQLSVASLGEFQSYDPQMMADLIDDPEMLEAAIAKAKPIQWFNPSEAQPTVKALQHHFESLNQTDRVIIELRDLEAVLSHAEKAGANFRLYIGF